MDRPELLSPAGSPEALRSAVQHGADAVYLGWGEFNARRSAKNFSDEEFREALRYCHARGVRVFLTLNTLLTDRELPKALETAAEASRLGIDAVLVQDWGLFDLLRKALPDLPLHASTQMSVFTSGGACETAADGCERVVIARECSAEETAEICKNCPVEIESFVHGALCMCYSGQCAMSALIGSRSGNRGRCAQPCRLPYGFGRSEHRYPLSLKDNCLVHYLRDLQEMGVASIKLEGRMKKPEYVATVTRVYRQALDEGNVTRTMEKALMDAFNRQGFTDGYYTGNIGPHMFGIRDDKTENAAWAKAARESYEAVENGLVPVKFRAVITPERSELTVRDPDGNVCKARGDAPQMARTRPLLAEDLAARLAKTGGTPFRCADVECRIEPGYTLSAASINAMRRDVLTQLMALRARRESPELGKARKIRDVFGRREEPGLTVQITAPEQLTGRLLKLMPQLIYVPLHLVTREPEAFRRLVEQGQHIAVVLPRIVHDGELEGIKQELRLARSLGIRDALVGNLGLMIPVRECGLHIRGDFGLNIFNSRAVDMCRQLELASATLSFEMTLPQIRDVSKFVDTELLIYGRMPLMVTENCIMKNRTGACVCQQGPQKLVDRTGAEFPIIKDGVSCRSVLLNGKKLSLLDRREDLSRLGLWGLRLYFTTENAREVDRVLRDFVNGAPFEPGSCTRGLYLRGLD